ncbi:uncharacterized protein LOC133242143 isoform X2 [Bos javanicus]|uniref:uncharacterized protein LOC133242143 isoform X2 n=1 Tax=Bos javanicus TaxID=9906 RepID=UPI002AA7051B|nr:uncharacterized protein LOC133242143 isoform X2 [Bos javanicus]
MDRGEAFGCSASKEPAQQSQAQCPASHPRGLGAAGIRTPPTQTRSPLETHGLARTCGPPSALRSRSPSTNAGVRHFGAEQHSPALNRNRKAGLGRHSTWPRRSGRGDARPGPAQEGSAGRRQAPGLRRHRADAGVHSAPPAPLKMPNLTWRRALGPLHPGVSSRAGTLQRGETLLDKRRRLQKPTERASNIQDLPQHIELTVPWRLSSKRISLQ